MKNNFYITVIGLGYVGLPLIKALSYKFYIQGIDADKQKILDIKNDRIDYENCDFIKKNKVNLYSSVIEANKKSNIYIICVPTPINYYKKPDLNILINVLKDLSKILKNQDLVIFESTYYPGLTKELSIKYLEKKNFRLNKNFYIGYSPERINPGDKINNLTNTYKLIACSNQKNLKIMKEIYGSICKNIHVCQTIEIAEMSKIIENVQRDINIAFINEILMICEKLNIPFIDVHNAAKTKWNFLNFYPGLVGGHCISVDTYYLKHLTKLKKINTKIIDSGRKTNEKMTIFFKKKIDLKFKNNSTKINLLFLGYSFKENVSDLRNSKNLELLNLFKKDKRYIVKCYDPLVEDLPIENFFLKLKKYDCIYFAVSHKIFKKYNYNFYCSKLKNKGFIFDPKNIFKKDADKKIISI